MTEHRLDPLLKPQRIALVGVSNRDASPGQTLAKMLLESDYQGEIYLINPGYPEILGQPCYPDLSALPVTVDHVVIALGNAHLEAALQATIDHGARAATIYASGIPEQDTEPTLINRLQSMAQQAGLEICGINGMGFYSQSYDLYAGIFPRAPELIKGGISYIAQSGSAFTTFCHNSRRLGFNLCVSSGNEITTSLSDYMDWSLEQSETRVIGLFVETVRDPDGFVAALEKANDRSIPVVVLKIGKSPLAAAMALTHTGAIAGNHAGFQALFKRFGVIEVESFDEMAAVLMLLQSEREASAGGLAAIFESGGFRELVTDSASDLGIEFSELDPATIKQLEDNLDPGLKAENPLDAWGSHERFEARFEDCFNALMQDPNIAAGVFISNYRDGYYLSEAIFRAVKSVSLKTGKPVAMASCFSDLANEAIGRRAHAAGFPLIDGTHETLLAFKHLFAYRDFKQQRLSTDELSPLNPVQVSKWQRRLNDYPSDTLSETEALLLLQDFSIPVVSHQLVDNEAGLIAASDAVGFPLVLKTAQLDINHKSDCNGVFVGIQSQSELTERYQDLALRLGPKALVAKMVAKGIEIGLGTVNNPQFGPLVMVAAGGVLVELLEDRAVALCPVSPQQAEQMVASLKINRLLQGVRGNAPVNRQALIDAIVKLSQFAYEFRNEISEIDVNPLLVNDTEAIAVDALVLRKTADTSC